MNIVAFSYDLQSLELKETALSQLSPGVTVGEVQERLNLPEHSIAMIDNVPAPADHKLRNGEILRFLPPMFGG